MTLPVALSCTWNTVGMECLSLDAQCFLCGDSGGFGITINEPAELEARAATGGAGLCGSGDFSDSGRGGVPTLR